MNARVHQYLDGELPLSSLTPDEVRQARRLERAVATLRTQSAELGDVDLTPRVMERIAGRSPAVERSAIARLVDWSFGKRQVSFAFRPVYAAAAVLLLLAAGLRWDAVALRSAATSGGAAEPTVFVRFDLRAPQARSVQLAGSFSNWSPDISLAPVGDGRWTAIVPLRPGVHDYAFRVDGERWTVDPSAPRVADGFGGFNSRLTLVVADS